MAFARLLNNVLLLFASFVGAVISLRLYDLLYFVNISRRHDVTDLALRFYDSLICYPLSA